MEEKESLLTLPELCEYLKLGQTTVRKMTKDEVIPCVKIGGSYRYKLEDVTAALDALPDKSEAYRMEEVSRSDKPKETLPIIASLRSKANASKNGKGDFDGNSVRIGYKTGFPQLDYYIGYKVNVYDNGDLVDSYPSLGIPSGSIVTLIGKPSTGKSTFAVQMAAQIVRPFTNGFVVHFDMERAANYTRIQTLTRFKMTDIMNGKYILEQDCTNVNDIQRRLVSIYEEKVSNPEKYLYHTGVLNEFGEEIVIFEPTVVILDSIATMTTGSDATDKKTLEQMEEVSSQTERMRMTSEITRFFNGILKLLSKANIIMLTINQIKDRPQLGFIPSPAEILGLDQNETLPGGKAPQYNASVLLKFIAIGAQKYKEEEDGFGGFGVRVKIIKCRGNQAGRTFDMIYDTVRGVDSLRSSIAFAKDLGLTGGNKNTFYFNSNKEEKFSLKNVHEDFRSNKNLYKILYANIGPALQSVLSSVEDADLEQVDEELDY